LENVLANSVVDVNRSIASLRYEMRYVKMPDNGKIHEISLPRSVSKVDSRHLFKNICLRIQGDWAYMHARSPELMTTSDLDGDGADEIVTDLGSYNGLWARSDDNTWFHLYGLN